MSEVTSIIDRVQHGESKAAKDFLLLIYDELRKLPARKLARGAPDQILQPTALVHEAWLR